MRDLGLADRIRAKGVEVIELAGWQTNGSDAFAPQGSVNHHTAGSPNGTLPSLGTLLNGNSTTPGPLCNVAQTREPDGNDKAVIIASGRANHAGQGGWNGLVGNSSVHGLEVEHTGFGTVPESRLETSARIHAAFLEGSSWNAMLTCQHFEWAPDRKVDFRELHPFTPVTFRERVAYWIGRNVDEEPTEPKVVNEIGGPGMDGIFHAGLLHVFSVDQDGALIERYGDAHNPTGRSVIMPAGWCRTGAEARVKVVADESGGYSVAALRAEGDICNVAYWNGSSWTLRGWPPA